MGYVPTTFPLVRDVALDTPEAAKAYLDSAAAARKHVEDAIVVAA